MTFFIETVLMQCIELEKQIKMPNAYPKLRLLDYFSAVHTNWWSRLGLARAYKVTGEGAIKLPDAFGDMLKDLEISNGVTLRSIFSKNANQVASELGVFQETRLGKILEDAFDGGANAIRNSDIPADLRVYYEGIYNQGYTVVSQQVRITTPHGTNPIPDFFFFKTKTDIMGKKVLDLNDIIYHDSKIHVSSFYSKAQEHIIETIKAAKANGTKAEFIISKKIEVRGYTIEAGKTISIKEMGKVATDGVDLKYLNTITK